MTHPKMLIFFSVVLLIYGGLNFYLFLRGWQALPSNSLVRIIFSVFFLSCTLIVLVSQIFEQSMPFKVELVLQNIGFVWLGVLLYGFLMIVFFDILRLINHFIPFFPDWLYLAKTKQILFCGTIAAIACILGFGYYSFRHPALVELNLQVAKPLPKEKPLRVVMMSDLHLGYIVNKSILKNYVERINALHPDIVVCAGDMVDRTLKPVIEQKMGEELKKINAPLGVYTILGNHEYIGNDISHTMNYLSKEGNVHFLRDSVVTLEDFILAGRDDRSNPKRKSIDELLASADKTKPIILLDHQPYHLEESEKNGVDIYFAGHTHDGQLWPFSLLVKRLYELAHGYKQKGNSHFYVSSGLGLWGPPFRIGTNSELVLVTITGTH